MSADRGQVDTDAARVYEELFVPSLFLPFASQVADRAGLERGHRVLDVACGTGVVARLAAERVWPTNGQVVGLDCNPGMLAVARSTGAPVDWHLGQAEALPFEDSRFDRVFCQFGIMFFDDPVAALVEMRRVLRPGGRLIVTTWAPPEEQGVYAPFIALLREHIGDAAADALAHPFRLGDVDALAALFAGAGMPGVAVESLHGVEESASLDQWVWVNVRAWTLSSMVDDAALTALQGHARRRLARWIRPDGSFASPNIARMVVAGR